MKKYYYIFLFLLSSYVLQAQPKQVVMLAIDGLSVDGFKQAKTPSLDALIAAGVLSLDTRCVMPSFTMPNWTSHLTAAGPEQHGVTSNSWTLQNQNFPAMEIDAEGYYPSIFKLLKETDSRIVTGFFYNWKELLYPFNQKYLDKIVFGEEEEYPRVIQEAADFIVAHKQDDFFVFLYDVHVDNTGHRKMWLSPEYIAALEDLDAKLGKFLTQLKEAKMYENIHFLITSDHGGHPKNQHGGQTIDEMYVPWGIVGPTVRKAAGFKEPNVNSNTGAVIAKLFRCQQLPKSWIGKVPAGIFK